MGIGPFDSFAFPGVYTKTLNEAPLASAAGALRFPAFIGVGDEVTEVTGYEMIRGSSSMADNKINLEDVSSQVTGTNRDFQVSFHPIVTGTGSGIVTTTPTDVKVYVNGDSAPVATVDGTSGIIYLMSPPALGDVVKATYYFKRSDTLYQNEDHSIQADGNNKVFKVNNVPIVEGNNGGITTTDPTKVIVKVNGSAVTVSAVDGDSGLVTVAAAPVLGATVTITYYSNDWQDTYDILPTNRVASITKVGYSSTSQDFVNTVDYVLDSTGQFSTINWGNSFKVATGAYVVGSTPFSSGQVSGTLYDNHIYRRQTVDGTANGTKKSFQLEYVPTSGSGLGKSTDNPGLVNVYVGTSPTSAVLADSSVASISAATKTVTFETAPASGQSVYVTQYQNMLQDDNLTLRVTTDGTYSMSGVNTGVAYDVTWSLSDTTAPGVVIEYPLGIGPDNRDTQVNPGYGTTETIILTFTDSSNYLVTSNVPTGTGSAGDNIGHLNQTYIDKKTGFRVTLVSPATGTYVTGNKVGYKSSPLFKTGAVPTRAIPGLKLFVEDTAGVDLSNTALVNTYNKSGAEPRIGDFYYISFLVTKEFNDSGLLGPVFVTTEKDALTFSGALTGNNRLGMAAHLAFLNGAPGMALLQVQKSSGGTDAPEPEYIAGIDAFNMPMAGGVRPSLMEPVTTSRPVLTYLKTSNTIQSSIRYANERMTYFGFPNGTTPSSAAGYAQAMNSELMTAIYPDGGIVTLTDALGNNVDYIVDGSFLAAAISGRDTSPAYDVAEPLTRKPVVGFTRLYRRMDSVTQAQVCNSGVTLLEEQAAGIVVKMDLTTDVSSVLTRTPSVIRIKQFVQKGTRSILTPYIGTKFLPTVTGDIEKTLSSYLSSLVGAGIIVAYSGVKATPDPNEPTTVNVVAYYAPVLPLLWVLVTFNLRSRV